MKKVYYILALTAALVAGCTQNEELSMIELPNGNDNTAGKNSLTATLDGGTRTMSQDGKSTRWVENDKIYVLANGSTVVYTTSEGGSTTAIFTTNASGVQNMSYAVYGPTSAPPTFSENTVTDITIPSSWAYSTDKNCANCIMMGEINTTNYTVAFKNAGAILYITLGSEINVSADASLTVTTESTPITGAATVTWNETDKAPTYTCTGTGKTITITGLSSVTGDKKIIIPMPVFINSDKIEVKLGDKLIFSESAKLERNKYYCIDYTTEGVQTVFSEEGLNAALAASNKIALGKDVSLTGENGTFTYNADIDLNGHKLTATKITATNQTLSITSSKEGGSVVANIETNTNLTLNNVILKGSIASTGGNNSLTGVTIDNENGDFGIKATAEDYNSTEENPAPKYTISNSTIKAKNTAIYLQYTDLVISGSTLSASAAQINNGEDGVGYCIAVKGGETTENPAKGNITLGTEEHPNTYSVTTTTEGVSYNVYIFANEVTHTGLDLNIANDPNVKITWKTPKPAEAPAPEG